MVIDEADVSLLGISRQVDEFPPPEASTCGQAYRGLFFAVVFDLCIAVAVALIWISLR
jgi:hypothetical protein